MVLNYEFVKDVFSFKPIIQPRQGDYLRYNFTMVDNFGIAHSTTFNLTFSALPFTVEYEGIEYEFNETWTPDYVKASVEMGDWSLLMGPEPTEEVWMAINVTDRSTIGSYPFNQSFCFSYIIPTDVRKGSEIPWILEYPGADAVYKAHVIEDDNVVIYGQQYPVWIVKCLISTNLNFFKFEASSGIMLSCNSSYPEDMHNPEVWHINLIESRVGDFAISAPSQLGDGAPFWLEWWFLPIIAIIIIAAAGLGFVLLRKRKHLSRTKHLHTPGELPNSMRTHLLLVATVPKTNCNNFA